MQTDVVLNMKLLNIVVITVLYQQKGFCFVKSNKYSTREGYKH